MNYLVYLDPHAGELEKILSGTKSMVVKEFDPLQPATHSVKPDDILYFLRGKDETILRVKAIVIHVVLFTSNLAEELSIFLKEMQPRLQFTEEQYNYWSVRKQVMLVEFYEPRKIPVINLKAETFKDRSNWIAFEKFSLI
jgi:hypothetical protein